MAKAGTTWRTAPAGTPCCYLCRRYRPADKMDGHRCADRKGCQKATAQMIGRPMRVPKGLRGPGQNE